MNIFPLVIAFILILSVCVTSFFQKTSAIHATSLAYEGFMNADRLCRNRMQDEIFKSQKKTKKHPASSELPELPDEEKTKSKKKFTKNPREQNSLDSRSRINISFLSSEDKGPLYDFLYETLAKLIKNLYGQASFFKENQIDRLEYAILDHLIYVTKTTPDLNSLSSSFPKEPKLREVFYKMLKGSNQFDLNIYKKNSYPALEDLLIFEKENEIILHFAHAPKRILEIFFDEHIATQVLVKEKLKQEQTNTYSVLNKNEFKSLVSEQHKTMDPTLIDQLLDFGFQPKKKKKIPANDTKTGIVVKKEYSIISDTE